MILCATTKTNNTNINFNSNFMKKIFTLFAALAMVMSMSAATYTAVGSSAPLFGTTWDTGNTDNDLQLKNGTLYELVKEVALKAGEIQYKIAVDHAWGTSYPGDNAILKIEKDGLYKVTFTFDESTKAVNATADFLGEVEVIAKIEVKGAWDNWGTTTELVLSDDKTTASVNVNVTKTGDFEFGINVDGAFTANKAEVTRQANVVSNLTGNTGNMKLHADAVGEYGFTWTYATNTLTVTYPAAGETPDTPDTPETPATVSYVLMGVGDDWKTGIAMTKNPSNENEYMLLNQPIAEGDSVKVVTLTNGEKTAYCGNVKDGVTVTITPDDKHGNIILAPGNYDFYYDVTADNIWIAAASETPDTPDTPDTPATYYITGNEALFGDKAWASDAIAMTEVEGVYTHTFTAVAAGVECQVKVTNGTWDASWGYTNLTTVPAGVTNTKDNNIVFTLAEAGDVVVTFSEEKITITGNFAVSDEPQVITYVLMGVGGDWETGIALTKNEQAEGEEYQLLGQEIAEGDAVKVVTLNNGTAIAWCGNVEEASVAHTADEKGNIVLAPGKYDFYFKVNDPATADDDIIYIGASNLSAVDNITTTVAPVKAIVNGQLVIIRDGVKYNVQGAVVK